MNRLLSSINLAVFFASILAIAVAFNYFAQRPELRWRIDATKTRAYSLSEQTMNMLRDLDGQWTIALVLIESETDRVVRRQIDEVLARFTQASPNISVIRVDPTNPSTLNDYEALLADLRHRYRHAVAEYEESVQAGRASFEQMLLFAQQQSGALERLLHLAQSNEAIDEASLQQVVRRMQSLALMADQGHEVLTEVDRAMRVSDAQPIPDYDVGRSIMVQALATAANELYETYEVFGTWLERTDLPVEVRSFIASVRDEFEQQARDLAIAADPLQHLPPMELSTIGRQLATGEAAVILGPGRAAVIASSQLFPRSNIRQVSEGVVAFDQRFRGEQLIAAGMRSLLVEHMPMVVFMHAGEESWLRSRDRQIDLLGAATMLNASRFDVHEWRVGSGEQPSPQRGQPVVWVPIPPPQRAGLEPSRQELELIAAVKRLIAEGESVLLSVYPSMLPRYGQVDPWADLASPFGLSAQTSSVIFESVRTATDQSETQRSQQLQRFASSHPLARALHGQLMHLSLPMALQPSQELPSGVRHETIAAIEPGPTRWLEPNWAADPSTLGNPAPEQRFDAAQPVILAATRPHPVKRTGEQRLLLVGSGGWMLTYIADAIVSAGGERVALSHPGNHELMLAGAAWLAGMDELIAQSPTGQEVARLEDIDDQSHRRWFWLLVVGLPAGCLAMGLLVWSIRRT